MHNGGRRLGSGVSTRVGMLRNGALGNGRRAFTGILDQLLYLCFDSAQALHQRLVHGWLPKGLHESPTQFLLQRMVERILKCALTQDWAALDVECPGLSSDIWACVKALMSPGPASALWPEAVVALVPRSFLGRIAEAATPAGRARLVAEFLLGHGVVGMVGPAASPCPARVHWEHPYHVYNPYREREAALARVVYGKSIWKLGPWTAQVQALGTVSLLWTIMSFAYSKPLVHCMAIRQVHARVAANITPACLLALHGIHGHARFMQADAQNIRPWVRLAKLHNVWVDAGIAGVADDGQPAGPCRYAWFIVQQGTQRAFLRVQASSVQGAWSMGTLRALPCDNWGHAGAPLLLTDDGKYVQVPTLGKLFKIIASGRQKWP